METVFIRSKVHGGEHTATSEPVVHKRGGFSCFNGGSFPFSRLSQASHLRTSSLPASVWEIPLTTRMRKLRSLCLSPNKGPVLLCVRGRPAAAAQPGAFLSPPCKWVSFIKSHQHSGAPSRILNVK